MSTELPDTTDEVARCLDRLETARFPDGGATSQERAKVAVVMHRKLMDRAGWVEVKVGEVPPWMKLVDVVNLTHDDGSGWFENVYRLEGEGDQLTP